MTKKKGQRVSISQSISAAIRGKLIAFINAGLMKYEKRKRVSREMIEEVFLRFGPHPVCYLTGEPIDWSIPSSYSLDHLVPVSMGGVNTIENMGVCTRYANRAKNAIPLQDFIDICCKIAMGYNPVYLNLEQSEIEGKITS